MCCDRRGTFVKLTLVVLWEPRGGGMVGARKRERDGGELCVSADLKWLPADC